MGPATPGAVLPPMHPESHVGAAVRHPSAQYVAPEKQMCHNDGPASSGGGDGKRNSMHDKCTMNHEHQHELQETETDNHEYQHELSEREIRKEIDDEAPKKEVENNKEFKKIEEEEKLARENTNGEEQLAHEATDTYITQGIQDWCNEQQRVEQERAKEQKIKEARRAELLSSKSRLADALNNLEEFAKTATKGVNKLQKKATQLGKSAITEEEREINELERSLLRRRDTAPRHWTTSLPRRADATPRPRVKLSRTTTSRREQTERARVQASLSQYEQEIKKAQQRVPLLKGMLAQVSEEIARGAYETGLKAPAASMDDTLDPRDSQVLALLNPFATPEGALERYNNLNGLASETLDPNVLNVTLDVDDEETVAAAAALGSKVPIGESEPLFFTAAPGERYQAMQVDLGFERRDGTRVILRVTADSGAAQCAISRAELERLHQGSTPVIMSTSRSFHDASGRRMPVLGRLTMTLYLGGCALQAQVFVFENLSVPFLLGTNAIVENGLVINGYSKTLYRAPELGSGKHCSAPLIAVRRNLLGMELVDEDPGDASTCHCEPAAPAAAAHGEYQLTCDRDQSRLLLAVADGAPVATHPCALDGGGGTHGEATHPASPGSHEYRATLRLLHDATLRPWQKGRGLYLEYETHCPEPECTLEITPSMEWLADFPVLRTANATLVSAFNLYALLPVSNDSPDEVLIPKGTVVGHATPHCDARRSTRPQEPLRVQLVDHARTGQAAPADELPFEQGGRPTTREHLIRLGFDLSKSIDPDDPKAGGGYHPLSEEKQQRLYDAALRWWWVWARDARAPETSRLVVIDIPTGDAIPVAQKPYPIPYAYKDAVLSELRKLLEGGLIEPTISAWASPILVRLKKDSTPEDIKLKIIVDYKRLNACTIPDSASLGDQEEIMDGFGGRQRFGGICDAAGGFYQYPILPAHRHKTAMVLPTSLGGTSFQWRVAPYGLTRNPAGYSRGMMFALQGLGKVTLEPNERGEFSSGGCASWIDDIAMHADSFNGFADLFERVLMRIAAASMQLKASKCFLLHERLEVLGYYVTPDGLIMQGEKLAGLIKRDDDGRLVAPANEAEIRTFLGAVQFYRRFVPRISMLAAPMTEKLKKNSKEPPDDDWSGVQQSFEAIVDFLQSSAVVSAPDLSDPRAEFVICTDACDIAAGGVLLQWQHPSGRGPGPPPGVPLRGGRASDPLTQSWRHDRGWLLRTIGYYSKTFDGAQRNYPTFDKESLAILFCVRKWAKLITCRPTTIYTDSSVASSMLTKHLGPARLQRWGMELGTFLPFLKVAYRKGVDNGMADFLSRYPTFSRYISRREDVAKLSEEAFDKLPETVPLFTHTLGDDDAWLRKAHYELYESREPQEIDRIWQHPEGGPVDRNADRQPSTGLVGQVDVADVTPADPAECRLTSALRETRVALRDTDFWREQASFEELCRGWEQSVGVFEKLHGRAPVLYDLCCGEGGFSRGARQAGARCFGFDSNNKFRRRYENDSSRVPGASDMCSGMKFALRDVMDEGFWQELRQRGKVGDFPPPDFIHVSPPCRGFSRLGQVSPGAPPPVDINLDHVIRRLKAVEEAFRERGLDLLWHVENVPESEPTVTEEVASRARLCGTMTGLRVFRHRVFYCNYVADDRLPHSHSGKWVGSRGVHVSVEDDARRFGSVPLSNMFGVYSSRRPGRGSADEWHGAMGFNPGTFSVKGLVGALPLAYGRLLTAQMTHRMVNKRVHVPDPGDRSEAENLLVDQLGAYGLHPFDHGPRAEALAPDLGDYIGLAQEGAPLDKPVETAEGATADRPYQVTRAQQETDPELYRVIQKLEGGTVSARIRLALEREWEIRDGLLLKRSIDSEGLPVSRLAVPHQGRGPLLRHVHGLSHRGGDPLAHEIAESYWWPGLHQDCIDYANACTVCGSVRSRPLAKAAVVPVATPSRPFNVIHVDHKGPLPRSGRYTNILVVVCALTRYTLYIPVPNVTAEETLKTLVSRVFSLFGYPLVIISDNGPAFRSDLMAQMASFFGFRHVPILPYNAAANGLAEAAVKRIKQLLDRHTEKYEEWHKVLPLAQLQLNTHVHTGTECSPFAALFGCNPVGLQHLENPALLPRHGSGSEWLAGLRERMKRIHSDLQKLSDKIKSDRAASANARRLTEVDSRAGQIKPGGWVRIVHGSLEEARYLRKHGHGEPWKYRYRVVEVRPHAVRLDVPKDGSVPVIGEWQLIRKCEPAPERVEEPRDNDPILTDLGVPVPGAAAPPSMAEPADLSDPDQVYEIERVLRAKKVGGRYMIWVKWKGFVDPTPMPKAQLLRESSNPELLREVEEAMQRYRDEYSNRLDPLDDDDPEPEAPPPAAEAPLGRGHRRRTARIIHNVSLVEEIEHDCLDHLFCTALSYASRLLVTITACEGP